MNLNKFIRSKIFKMNTIIIVFFSLSIVILLSFFIIRNHILEENSVKSLKNYLSIQTHYFFVESEENYNERMKNLLLIYYNNNYENIDDFMNYVKKELSQNNQEELIVDSANFYLINSQGIIYESDFEKDIGVDIKRASMLWNKLKNLTPGKIFLDTIAEEVRTGRNRLYSYLKLDNGDIFELGLSFKNISKFYIKIKNELKENIVEFNIFNSYYMSLLNNDQDLTKNQKIFFNESYKENKLISKRGFLKDEYFYTISSDFGNKYLLFSVKNHYLISLIIIITISMVILYFYIKYLRKKVLEDVNNLSSVVSDIAKDMTFFDKNSNSNLDYIYTGVNEIDVISKRYIDLSKEINTSFEVLKAMNEQLEEYYRNNELLIEKMNKLTKLVVEIKKYKKDDEIFSEIFNMLFDFIPVSDTGLLIRLDQDYIRVVDAKGYDVEKINQLKISTKNYIGLDKITIVKGNNPEIRTIDYSNVPVEKYNKLKELIYPVEYSLYIPIKTDNQRYGAITLNILETKKNIFR